MDINRFNLSGKSVGNLGVAICLNPFPHCNTHVGIIYRDARERLWVVHLAWHKTLRNNILEDDFSVATPNLDPLEEPYLAEYCAKVGRSSRNHRNIPFNLRYDPDTQFDEDGHLRLSPSGTGLNCATFVVTVFRSAGRPLVQPDTWLIREGQERRIDEAVHQRYVASLSQDPDPDRQKQAKIIQPEIGCFRIRPHEVAGACLESILPATFSQCGPNGEYVLEMLAKAKEESRSAQPANTGQGNGSQSRHPDEKG
jgi:hypothetical protein